MKHIVVTGGAGFIGSNLIRYLLKENPNVRITCVDNFLSSHPDNLVVGDDRVQVLVQDVIYPLKLEGNVHEIYHLACAASPKIYQQNSVHTIKTCVIGTMNVLEFAKEKNAKVLFTSTSEIYGDPLEHPQKEIYRGNVNCYGPRACYDEGKRMAETLMYEYRRVYKVDTRIIRIFNTYGPFLNPDDGRVVSNFVTQVQNNDPITIYGDGKQTRSLCYVDDTVEAMCKCMETEYEGPINIGNPTEYTVLEIAEQVMDVMGRRVPIIYHPLPVDDPQRRRPDISMAKILLKWEPKTSLRDGLNKMINKKIL